MKTTKNPLTGGQITVSIRNRVSSDGKTVRQKSFVRTVKKPTSPAASTPTKPAAPAPAPPPEAAPLPATAAETAPGWTAEQDAQLLELKGKNTSWKQISILMDGRAQGQLRDRFKELGAKAAEAEAAKTADQKKMEEAEEKKKAAVEEKKKTSEERKKAWEEKMKQKEKDKEEAEKQEKGAGAEPAKAPEAKEEPKIVFVENGKFSLDEIVLIYKLAERYDNRKWLEVASKFFDTTGKRVHPEELRDALSGSGGGK